MSGSVSSLAIAATSAVKAEGNSGSTAFTFTVTRTGATNQASTANWAVMGSGSNAAAAADFFGNPLPTGVVSFAAGETSKIITVLVAGDSVVESDEGFAVTLSSPSAGTAIGAATATGTILNDDASLAIAAADAIKLEGNTGSTAYTFTVTRSGYVSQASTASWTVAGSGTNPAAASDFVGGVLPSGTVSFAAGETSKTITVLVAGDSVVESEEGFMVSLSNASAGTAIGTVTAAGTIQNDDTSLATVSMVAGRAIGWEGDAVYQKDGYSPVIYTQRVKSIVNAWAFAALKQDGSVVTWGRADKGGNSNSVSNDLVGIDHIVPSNFGFSAIRNDGNVVYWGQAEVLNVKNQLQSDVVEVFSSSDDEHNETDGAMVALKADGSVVAWGPPNKGGDITSVASLLQGQVQGIFAGTNGFVAIRKDGQLVAWGDPTHGGINGIVSPQASAPVVDIQHTRVAYAALRADGSVFTWGDNIRGGDSFAVASQLTSGVVAIRSSEGSFVAIKENGSVVTWGNQGNISDTHGIPGGAVVDPPATYNDVVDVQSNDWAFAALQRNGSVLTWGSAGYGGDSSSVSSQLQSGVVAIYSNRNSFAALKSDGSVVTWGNAYWGGDSSAVAAQLRSGVVSISSTIGSYAALKADGSVVTWGPNWDGGGGDSSTVSAQLQSGVVKIYANSDSFAALKADGSIVTWGDPTKGGDSSAVSAALQSGVVSVASPPASKALTKTLYFYATRDGNLSQSSVVDWAVVGSGAAPATAADFAGGVLPSGRLTFAAGETQKVIGLELAGDSAAESDEGFTVILSNASAGTAIGAATATGTILNDDATLAIAAADAIKLEGNTGSTAYTFTVTRSGYVSQASTASWTVAGSGTNPAAASDFVGGVLPSGTVSFAAGETSKTITIPVSGDTTVEANEGFTVTLTSPSSGAVIGTATATGTIINDDASLAIAAADATKLEGQSGSPGFTFIVTRSGDTSVAHTASWAVTGSGANPATSSDFTGNALPSGIVSFGPGPTTQTITVQVSGDTTVEAYEGFTVTLASPSTGAVIGTAAATGTILNDDTSTTSTPSISGIVYHWKSHALLSGVAVTAETASSGTTNSALQFRDVRTDSAGRVLLDLWGNGDTNVGSFGAELTLGTGLTASFQSNLPTDWSVLQNSSTPGTFSMAGFGLTSVSGSFKLGTITLTKSTSSTPLNVGLTYGDYGSRTAAPLSLGFYTDDTGADGAYLMDVAAGSYTMSASRGVTDIGRAVTSADALAALKLAVGLNPNTDPDGTGPLLPLRVSPYQFMAADVTGDGRVSSADALAILKMAVRAADAPTARWTFLDATDTYWDANASAFTVTRTSVPSPQPIVVDVNQGVRQDVVGLVSGDVNGSWRPLDANGNALADGSYPVVADAYLIGQATALGVPTDLWGM